MIWFKPIQLSDLQSFDNDSLGRNLGMEFSEIGEDFLKMKMLCCISRLTVATLSNG